MSHRHTDGGARSDGHVALFWTQREDDFDETEADSDVATGMLRYLAESVAMCCIGDGDSGDVGGVAGESTGPGKFNYVSRMRDRDAEDAVSRAKIQGCLTPEKVDFNAAEINSEEYKVGADARDEHIKFSRDGIRWDTSIRNVAAFGSAQPGRLACVWVPGSLPWNRPTPPPQSCPDGH